MDAGAVWLALASPAADTGRMAAKAALVVRGGWDGHVPVAATELFIPSLVAHGFDGRVQPVRAKSSASCSDGFM